LFIDEPAMKEENMKAAYIQQVGPPQAIHYGDLPMPTVGRNDVLVKVEAVPSMA
jgi:NADPH:quinone reductase-like Zn-dependent oxidoreductase